MICMELMDMSLNDLRLLVYERLNQGIPECVLGKMAESVSTANNIGVLACICVPLRRL